MSSTDRQSRLLATEDWKKIYQSFRNADFQSYDFDNLRRTMINYLRQNYPEDFNDYIESSEYLALIDLIAFLGQNLSFRIDLNARENFLETAERRESILRLARLISYNASRNKAANGLLKFDTISTSESVFDSSGRNLANTTIRWNDISNSNYFEQFIKIINAALPAGNRIGRPSASADISGVATEQYRFNSFNDSIPIFNFKKTIEGITTNFEIVSTAINNNSIIEEPPLPGNNPSFLYRDDGQGAGSSNTGFFMHFRQGTLETANFRIENAVPNEIVSIDTRNINNDDIWLYSLDGNSIESTFWTKLDTVEGNNIIYNSIFEDIRNVYNVTTRADDRINLVFSDGVFGNLPSGNFRAYYRTSANRSMVIAPSNLNNIVIQIPYISKTNTNETLSIGLSLKYTVTNGAVSESNDSIRQNAPSTYYTQNRLITAEDYNIGPLGLSTEIIKTKSVNRISSGISRYYDLIDPSGKYSNTSIFADDGVLYKEEFTLRKDFDFVTRTDIEGVIVNTVEAIIDSNPIRNFYYENFNRVSTVDLNATWESITSTTNSNTGRILDIDNSALPVGSFTNNSLRFLEPDCLLKFTPPIGQYFLPDGTLTTDATARGAVSYKWVKNQSVYENGTEILETGIGPIIINDIIPSGSSLVEIIPKLSRIIVNDVRSQIIDRTFALKDFALRYDQNLRRWVIIIDENINVINDFNLGKAGNTSGENLDSSWLLYFKTNGEKYTITYRNLRYIFESENDVRFFFDSADKIYDSKTGKILKDKIDILSINTQPDNNLPFNRDFAWSITDSYRDPDGYVDTRKISLDFFDSDDDGVPDNPEIFNDIISEFTNTLNKIIIQKKYTTSDGVEDFKYLPNTDNEVIILQNEAAVGAFSQYTNQSQVFYLSDEGIFKNINGNRLTINSNYKAFIGRDNLKFHYTHVADSNYRIDPASSNIIDTYVLTKSYDDAIRNYLSGGVSIQPLPPSSEQLFNSFGGQINSIKSISDEVIYHPVKYKILFGQTASEDLQVTFKVVKNKDLVINDNELKTNIISYIDRFFAIENWSFGETFYFQELSSYIMSELSPEILSIVVVPKKGDKVFGSLFEIKSESDEIFISSAKVTDIELIDEITASNLQASGNIVTSISSNNSGIQSGVY